MNKVDIRWLIIGKIRAHYNSIIFLNWKNSNNWNLKWILNACTTLSHWCRTFEVEKPTVFRKCCISFTSKTVLIYIVSRVLTNLFTAAAHLIWSEISIIIIATILRMSIVRLAIIVVRVLCMISSVSTQPSRRWFIFKSIYLCCSLILETSRVNF